MYTIELICEQVDHIITKELLDCYNSLKDKNNTRGMFDWKNEEFNDAQVLTLSNALKRVLEHYGVYDETNAITP